MPVSVRTIAAAGALCGACSALAEPITFTSTGVIGRVDAASFDIAALDAVEVGDFFSFSVVFDSTAAITSTTSSNAASYGSAILSFSLVIDGQDFGGVFTANDLRLFNQGSDDVYGANFGADNGSGGIFMNLEGLLGLDLIAQDNAFPDPLGTDWLAAISQQDPILTLGGSNANRERPYMGFGFESFSWSVGENPVVPLPSVAGLGLVGLAAVGSRRRR